MYYFLGSNSVGTINSSTKGGWIPQLFGLDYGWNLVIVLALTVAMFIYLKYSKQGYEIAVVGESENTARYAGINVKRVILRTMALSGAVWLDPEKTSPYDFYQYSRRQRLYSHYRFLAE